MSKSPRPRKGPPIWLMTAMQRSRHSWTSWSLRRTQRRLKKEALRFRRMQAQLDNQLLLLKRLSEQELLLLQEQQEQREIQAFRVQQLPLPPGTSREQLEEELLA